MCIYIYIHIYTYTCIYIHIHAYTCIYIYVYVWVSQVVLAVNNMPANAGDTRDVGLVPGLGRSPGGGHGNPFQYSCLENPHGQRSLKGYSP